jgi:hypothetical protein
MSIWRLSKYLFDSTAVLRLHLTIRDQRRAHNVPPGLHVIMEVFPCELLKLFLTNCALHHHNVLLLQLRRDRKLRRALREPGQPIVTEVREAQELGRLLRRCSYADCMVLALVLMLCLYPFCYRSFSWPVFLIVEPSLLGGRQYQLQLVYIKL